MLGNYKSLRGHPRHMHNTPQWHHFKVAESHFVDESFIITTATAALSVTLCSAWVSITNFKVAKQFKKNQANASISEIFLKDYHKMSPCTLETEL